MEFQELKKEISSRINIVHFIQQYFPLKKRGNNYFGNCPFHKEKTASFSVSEEKGLYYCFGCFKGGDVYQFLIEYKSCSFYQSLCELAEFLSIPIEKNHQKILKQDEKISLLNLFKKAEEYFHKTLLMKDNLALNYLFERGINLSSIEKFCLGFSETSSYEIIKFLEKEGFSIEKQLESKLIFKSIKNQNNFYCYFYGRIIFPIFDEHNRTVAFGGRILNATNSKNPKYINSFENVFFSKKNILYAFNFAKGAIKEKKSVYLVEGYLDVIRMFQEGIENVLAPLGTSLTENHLKLLGSYVDRIYLLFDGDEAGIRASCRALEYYLNLDLNVEIFVISLPIEEDPASCLQKWGVEKFSDYLKNNVQKLLYFLISNYFKKLETEALSLKKREILHNIYMLISKLKSWVEKEEALQFLSFLLKVRYKSVFTDYEFFLRKHEKSFITNKTFPLNQKISILENPELYLALFFIHHFSFWKEKRKLLLIDFCKDRLAKQIFILLNEYLNLKISDKELSEVDNKDRSDTIYNFILAHFYNDEDSKQKIQSEFFNDVYLEDPENQIEELLFYFKRYYIRIKIKSINENIKKLSEKEISFEEDFRFLIEEKQFWLNEFYKFSKQTTRRIY